MIYDCHNSVYCQISLLTIEKHYLLFSLEFHDLLITIDCFAVSQILFRQSSINADHQLPNTIIVDHQHGSLTLTDHQHGTRAIKSHGSSTRIINFKVDDSFKINRDCCLLFEGSTLGL